jgi:Tol biopolymer transport system component
MFAFAPDGSAIVYVAGGNIDFFEESLFVRELDHSEARKLSGTEGASYPFWSPDGKEIAYFAGGSLRRVPREGGAVRTICPSGSGRGGSWSRNGTIVFAPGPYSALMRVNANGGEPSAATRLDPATEERSHRFPQFLPDGRHFLFGVEPWSTEMQVRVAALDEVTAGRPLLQASTVPRFAAPNHLVFVRDQALLAQTIDLERLAMTGEARQLDDRPNLVTTVTSEAPVDASIDGKLLYAPADPLPAVLAWYSRSGSRTETPARLPGGQFSMAVSHGGDRLAAMVNTSAVEGSLWIVDAESGDAARITPPGIQPWEPVWSWDERQVAANIAEGGASADIGPGLVTVESGDIRRVVETSYLWRQPTDLSSDGRVLIYTELTTESDSNVGWLRLDGAAAPAEYVASPATEVGGKLSPDGRFLAYLSGVSGRMEVYVDTFPEPSHVRRVETGGSARQVAFRDDGRELFVLADLGGRAILFSFMVQPGSELGIGSPQKLFTLPLEWLAFAPSPKGDRFYTLERPGNRSPTLTLVENWRAQLEAKR